MARQSRGQSKESKQAAATAKAPSAVTVVREDFPSVPGSSLRGVLREELERFLTQAEAYKRAHSSTKEAALRKLIELGILDQSGNLTKNYR